MTFRYQLSAGLLIGSLAFSSAPVLASGYIGPWPLAEQRFQDQSACVAHLESLRGQDLAMADARPQPAEADGTTLQRMVNTKGLERIDDRMTRYNVHVGRQFRIPRPDIKAIRTTYSYEERDWICERGKLSGKGSGGYYLDGYEYEQPSGQ